MDHSAGPGPRRRILVVHDNLRIADPLIEGLRTTGHEIYVAFGAARAVELVCEIFPDVMIVDLHTPALGGLALADRVRQLQLPRQPLIVAATKWQTPDEGVLGEAAGVDVHLTRPVEIGVLRTLLEAEVETGGAERLSARAA